ncbi:MAG: hypothetical protein JXA22_05030 [Candidatus Thermoplasmatota archaeon]|nr:hypothetical protein [Candidatus Thermoplasmatota archaeon]
MAKKASKESEKPQEPGPLEDVFTGELKNRHYGIRIDDDIEVLVIAGNDLLTYRGRLLSVKEDLEMIGEDGLYQKIIMDWVVGIKVLNHNRPTPEKDAELVKRIPRTKPKKVSVDHAYN